jgi:hypothetical protein
MQEADSELQAAEAFSFRPSLIYTLALHPRSPEELFGTHLWAAPIRRADPRHLRH